jgi:hypothetical protein
MNAMTDVEHFSPQVFRLTSIPTSESKSETSIEDVQPIGRFCAWIVQGFVKQIEKLFVAGQFFPLVRKPVLMPSGGHDKSAFRNHRIDKENEWQLNLLPLGLQPWFGTRSLCDIREKLFDIQTELLVLSRSRYTSPLASESIEQTDLFEQRFAEFKQSHVISRLGS